MCQGSKYAQSSNMFDRILKMSQVLKKQGLHRFPNIFDYGSIYPNNAEICLNMPQYCWLSLIRPENAWMNCSHQERTREFSGQGNFCGIRAICGIFLEWKIQAKDGHNYILFFIQHQGTFFSFWKKAGKASP